MAGLFQGAIGPGVSQGLTQEQQKANPNKRKYLKTVEHPLTGEKFDITASRPITKAMVEEAIDLKTAAFQGRPSYTPKKGEYSHVVKVGGKSITLISETPWTPDLKRKAIEDMKAFIRENPGALNDAPLAKSSPYDTVLSELPTQVNAKGTPYAARTGKALTPNVVVAAKAKPKPLGEVLRQDLGLTEEQVANPPEVHYNRYSMGVPPKGVERLTVKEITAKQLQGLSTAQLVDAYRLGLSAPSGSVEVRQKLKSLGLSGDYREAQSALLDEIQRRAGEFFAPVRDLARSPMASAAIPGGGGIAPGADFAGSALVGAVGDFLPSLGRIAQNPEDRALWEGLLDVSNLSLGGYVPLLDDLAKAVGKGGVAVLSRVNGSIRAAKAAKGWVDPSDIDEAIVKALSGGGMPEVKAARVLDDMKVRHLPGTEVQPGVVSAPKPTTQAGPGAEAKAAPVLSKAKPVPSVPAPSWVKADDVETLKARMLADGVGGDVAKVAAELVSKSKGSRVSAIAEYLTRGPSGTEVQSGLNLRSMYEKANKLDVSAQEMGLQGDGFFMTDVGERKPDYSAVHRLMQPLDIVDGSGQLLQSGTYSRLGGNMGAAASSLIRGAEQSMTATAQRWRNAVDDVDRLIRLATQEKRGRRVIGRKALDRAYSDFIDLVELPKNHPSRLGATGHMRDALDLHDAMTESMRRYIVRSRKALGIPVEKGWGVTDKGYFRHMFLGDIVLYKDGAFYGTAKTYAEAQALAVKVMEADPGAKLYATARNMASFDPVTRVSSARYFKLVSKLGDRVRLSGDEIMEDLRGIIGREATKEKFAGFLQHRKGARGFSRDYHLVMTMYAAQVSRTQSLGRLNKALTPVIENIRVGRGTPGGQPLPGLADEIKGHLDDLWGIPTQAERQFGEFVRQVPILRNFVPAPDYAMRSIARRITGVQYFLKLRFNIKSASVNMLQPLTTLWPYVSTKDFAALYADYLKPATRDNLRRKGVFQAGTKIEGQALGVTVKNKVTGLDPFRSASAVNRGVGYLYGYRKAIKAGLPENQAHASGLAWAERVEFDNSQWNVQPAMRSPIAQVIGQFKAFQGKNLEHVARGVWGKGGTKIERAQRVIKWVTAQGLLGGLKGTGAVASIVGAGTLVDILKEHLVNQGMSDKDAQAWAQAVYRGAPAMIGADISSSVSIFEEPYGRDLGHQVVNILGGPTVGTAVNFGEALKQQQDAKNPESKAYAGRKAIKALTPLVNQAEVLGQLIKPRPGGNGVSVRVDADEWLALTPAETVLVALGFTPVRLSATYEDKVKKASKKPSP